MSYKIINVSLEHQHALKRRMASRIQMEPVIAGERLRLRQSRILTDEQYEINKDLLLQCEKDGVITISNLDEKKAKVDDKPKKEEPVKAQLDEAMARAAEPHPAPQPPPPVASHPPHIPEVQSQPQVPVKPLTVPPENQRKENKKPQGK